MPTPLEIAKQEELRHLGQDIARLLLSLKIPDQVKMAWADSIPKMTPQELRKAIAILSLHAYDDIIKEVEAIRGRLDDITK